MTREVGLRNFHCHQFSPSPPPPPPPFFPLPLLLLLPLLFFLFPLLGGTRGGLPQTVWVLSFIPGGRPPFSWTKVSLRISSTSAKTILPVVICFAFFIILGSSRIGFRFFRRRGFFLAEPPLAAV